VSDLRDTLGELTRLVGDAEASAPDAMAALLTRLRACFESCGDDLRQQLQTVVDETTSYLLADDDEREELLVGLRATVAMLTREVDAPAAPAPESLLEPQQPSSGECDGFDDERVDEELMREFVIEGTEQLAECGDHLLLLEREPQGRASLDAVFRCFHTIKGVAGFLGMSQLQEVAHVSEDLLDAARGGKLSLEGPCLEVIFDSAEILGQLINAIPASLTHSPWLPP